MEFWLALTCFLWLLPNLAWQWDGITPCTPSQILVCSGCHLTNGWLQPEKHLLTVLEAEIKVKVSAGLASPEASLLGLQMTSLLVVSLSGLSPVHAHSWGLCLFFLILYLLIVA